MSKFLVKFDGPHPEEVEADYYYVDRVGNLTFAMYPADGEEHGVSVESFASGEWVRVKRIETDATTPVSSAGDTWVPLSGERVLG